MTPMCEFRLVQELTDLQISGNHNDPLIYTEACQFWLTFQVPGIRHDPHVYLEASLLFVCDLQASGICHSPLFHWPAGIKYLWWHLCAWWKPCKGRRWRSLTSAWWFWMSVIMLQWGNTPTRLSWTSTSTASTHPELSQGTYLRSAAALPPPALLVFLLKFLIFVLWRFVSRGLVAENEIQGEEVGERGGGRRR